MKFKGQLGNLIYGTLSTLFAVFGVFRIIKNPSPSNWWTTILAGVVGFVFLRKLFKYIKEAE